MKQLRYSVRLATIVIAALNMACGGGDNSAYGTAPAPIVPPTPPATTTPVISAATGQASAGNTITITGGAFGEKAQPAPFIWDTFESGPVGAPITNNQWVAYSSSPPTYSSTDPYSGALAGYKLLPASSLENFDTAGRAGLNNATEVYVSYYFRYLSTSSAGASFNPFIKLLRVNGPGEFYRSCPSMVAAFDTENPRFYQGVTNTLVTLSGGSFNCGAGIWVDNEQWPADGAWTRIEHYLRLSTPAGAANGASLTWTNLRLSAALRDIVSRDTAVADRGYESVLLPFMASNKTGWQYDNWVDDVYVDTTQASVEIGNAAALTDCTVREIQPASAWSNGSITFQYNPGRLPSTGDLYLYVTNSNGLTNTSGYRVR